MPDDSDSLVNWNTTNPQTSDFFPSMDSQFKELQDQYAAVPGAYDTSAFDKQVKDSEGFITTQAEQSGNSAAAEYTNRERQAGGNGEGAGLVKAQALVQGRTAVEDMKQKAAQYDIDQREKASNQASVIASTIGNLRDSYLKTLASYNASMADVSMRERVSKNSSALGWAQLNEQTREWSNLHPDPNLAQRQWSGTTDMFGNFKGLNQYGLPYGAHIPGYTPAPTYSMPEGG